MNSLKFILNIILCAGFLYIESLGQNMGLCLLNSDTIKNITRYRPTTIKKIDAGTGKLEDTDARSYILNTNTTDAERASAIIQYNLQLPDNNVLPHIRIAYWAPNSEYKRLTLKLLIDKYIGSSKEGRVNIGKTLIEIIQSSVNNECNNK